MADVKTGVSCPQCASPNTDRLSRRLRRCDTCSHVWKVSANTARKDRGPVTR